MEREHELHTRRRGRNIGLMTVLCVFVVLIFAVTIVKLGGNAANPSADVTWGEAFWNWVYE